MAGIGGRAEREVAEVFGVGERVDEDEEDAGTMVMGAWTEHLFVWTSALRDRTSRMPVQVTF